MTESQLVSDETYPTEITMPVGSGPESIVVGRGPFAYVSAMGTGDILRVDFRTGTYELFLPAIDATAVGMALDWRGRLYICGGMTGRLWVVDTADRSLLATYQLGGEQTFINELIVTPDAAYVTDSFSPVLYKLPFGNRGELPAEDEVVHLPLGGDLVYQQGETFAECFNTNGIATTPDESAVLVVQTNTGKLFRVDTGSGTCTVVDLGGDTVPWGDGLVREDNTLHVVQNLANLVSVVELNPEGTAGKVVETWSDPRFDTPTAMARFGSRFYLSNARFTTPDHEAADFRLIAVER
jgi:sugar lactone lactonase YvrE